MSFHKHLGTPWLFLHHSSWQRYTPTFNNAINVKSSPKPYLVLFRCHSNALKEYLAQFGRIFAQYIPVGFENTAPNVNYSALFPLWKLPLWMQSTIEDKKLFLKKTLNCTSFGSYCSAYPDIWIAYKTSCSPLPLFNIQEIVQLLLQQHTCAAFT